MSVIVPAYVASDEQAQLLLETLGTTCNQTLDSYEVIVVDDGSPVDVARIVRNETRLGVVRQWNAGSAVARNTGVKQSRGEFLVFLDADDHLLPRALEAGVAALREHPDCGFSIGRREEITYDGDPVPWGIAPPPPTGDLYNVLLGFDWYIIPPSSAMFRRSVFDDVGGFRDPWGADDLDFYLRVAQKHRCWCFSDPPVTSYRRYAASSSRDGQRMLRSMRVVYERQREFIQGHPAREAAFERGLSILTEIFRDCLIENIQDRVRARQWLRAFRSAVVLARESPRRLLRVPQQLQQS